MDERNHSPTFRCCLVCHLNKGTTFELWAISDTSHLFNDEFVKRSVITERDVSCLLCRRMEEYRLQIYFAGIIFNLTSVDNDTKDNPEEFHSL